MGNFTWRVSDCEELVGVTHRRDGVGSLDNYEKLDLIPLSIYWFPKFKSFREKVSNECCNKVLKRIAFCPTDHMVKVEFTTFQKKCFNNKLVLIPCLGKVNT